ncbi:MAG: choice-of-anchor tandem repeat GloVer-containing protein, partial [Candidatus Acidiferrum sp.]
TSAGVVTVLHSFTATDGATPNQLVLANDGNLYGTTISGGAHSDGIVFEVTPQGAFNTLHAFAGSDGADSFSGLMQATNGTLYGTTRVGGAKNDGTVFGLNVGLN